MSRGRADAGPRSAGRDDPALRAELAALKAQATELDRQELLHEARASLYVFATRILGYPDLVTTDDARNPSRLVCQWLQDTRDEPRRMLLLPRDSFKTTIATISYPLWEQWTLNPNLRVLLWMETYNKAVAKLGEIKNHLEGVGADTRFRAMVGNWVSTQRTARWKEDMLDLAIKTRWGADPSYLAAGVDSDPTSFHFDLLVADDPCSHKNSQSPETLATVQAKFKAVQGTLDSKRGRVVIVGTRWDDGDLYGVICRASSTRIEAPWAGNWVWSPAGGWAQGTAPAA